MVKVDSPIAIYEGWESVKDFNYTMTAPAILVTPTLREKFRSIPMAMSILASGKDEEEIDRSLYIMAARNYIESVEGANAGVIERYEKKGVQVAAISIIGRRRR